MNAAIKLHRWQEFRNKVLNIVAGKTIIVVVE